MTRSKPMAMKNKLTWIDVSSTTETLSPPNYISFFADEIEAP